MPPTQNRHSWQPVVAIGSGEQASAALAAALSKATTATAEWWTLPIVEVCGNGLRREARRVGGVFGVNGVFGRASEHGM